VKLRSCGEMGLGASYVERFCFYPPPPRDYRDPKNVVMLTTKSDVQIPFLAVRKPNAQIAVLYSHGNGEDLPALEPLLNDFSRHFDSVSWFGYDYPGYSNSRGLVVPSERHCFEAIEASFEHLQKHEGFQSQQIVLFGRSLGTGPTCHMASTTEARIKGVILQSPLMSAIRVVKNTPFSLMPDVFCNIDKMHRIVAPLLVMHGTADEVINVFHGRKLFTLAQNPVEPLWLVKGTHNNLEHYFFGDMTRRIHDFFIQTEQQRPGLSRKEVFHLSGLPKHWWNSVSSFTS